MWKTLFAHRSGICIAALGILEAVALCVPGIMSKGFAYILLFAFLATMLAINLNTLHNFLKRRHKGGYSL